MIPDFDASREAPRLVPVEVLRVLQRRADALGVEMLLVGAAARDLAVHLPGGLDVERATNDVDVAVAVRSFAQFREFVAGFPPWDASGHKFDVLGVQVDVIPFSDAEPRGVDFDGRFLDTTGLVEAADDPLRVAIEDITIAVAPLPAQAVLKILAWRDRGLGNTKDARDLATILAASAEGQYADVVWESDETLAKVDYDIVRAGPYLAGVLAARPFDVVGGQAVLGVLDLDFDRLLRAMTSRPRLVAGGSAAERLDAFREGFRAGLIR